MVLDALGLPLLERHAGHPLLERLDLTPLRSQFPSTTTAHMTTLHYGLPVERHGLYEWLVREPSLGRVICPLRHERAEDLAPGPTFYETLGAPSLVLHPQWIAGSSYSRAATRGAGLAGFEDLAGGLRELRAAFADDGDLRYALLYWDVIDATGHVAGPDSPEFAAAAAAALDAVLAELAGAAGVTVLLTADHGQVPVAPERVDYLDELWPELPALLDCPQPAGSSRDVFLHVRDGAEQEVIDGLSERLGDRARVLASGALFPAPGERLRERVGDVVVLPAAGREAWLATAKANEQWFRGQHGGLDPAETSTYLAVVAR